MAKPKTEHGTPQLFQAVKVRFPAMLHPTQPRALGWISDVVEGQALVFVMPNRFVPMTTVRVPHRSAASADGKSGWWEAWEEAR